MKKWMPYHYKIPLAEGEVPLDKGGFRTVQIIIDNNDTPESITNKVLQAKDQLHRDILVQGIGAVNITTNKPEKGRQEKMK